MGTGCKIMQEEIFRYMENGGGKIVINKERKEKKEEKKARKE